MLDGECCGRLWKIHSTTQTIQIPLPSPSTSLTPHSPHTPHPAADPVSSTPKGTSSIQLLLTIFTAATLVPGHQRPCLTGLPCMPLVIYDLFPINSYCKSFQARPSHLTSILTVAYKGLPPSFHLHSHLLTHCSPLYCFPAMWAFLPSSHVPRHFSISGPLCFLSLLLRLLCP